MIGEIGLLLVVFLVLFFVIEIGVPAALGDREYFWITKSLFSNKKKSNSKKEPVNLDESIKLAEKAVEDAKSALELISNSVMEKSSEAKQEYVRLRKIYSTAKAKLDALNKTKSRKNINLK